MTQLQQLQPNPIPNHNDKPQPIRPDNNHTQIKTNKLEQLTSVQTKNYHDEVDQEDRILINKWMGKYTTQQTQQEDDFDDQSEDDDIRKFLQEQIPGLYRQNHFQSNNRTFNKPKQNTPQVIGLNGGSLCRQYLGMSRWQKQSFFEDLNEIYMRRMECVRKKSNSKNDLLSKAKTKRSIRFNEVIFEVPFNKQEQPSVIKDTAEEQGMIVFDEAAYEQEQSSVSNSSSSISSSNSEYDQLIDQIEDKRKFDKIGQDSFQDGDSQDEDLGQEQDQQDELNALKAQRYCKKRLNYLNGLDSDDEIDNIYCEDQEQESSSLEKQSQSSSSSQQSQSSPDPQSPEQKQKTQEQKQETQEIQNKQQDSLKSTHYLNQNQLIVTQSEQYSQKQLKIPCIESNVEQQKQQRKFKRDIDGQLIINQANTEQVLENKSLDSNHQLIPQPSGEEIQQINGRKIKHLIPQSSQKNHQQIEFILEQKNTLNTTQSNTLIQTTAAQVTIQLNL